MGAIRTAASNGVVVGRRPPHVQEPGGPMSDLLRIKTAARPATSDGTFRVVGPVLERARDDDGELGFVYERRGVGARGEATFADAALIFARGATVLESRGADGTMRLDTWSYLVLPAG